MSTEPIADFRAWALALPPAAGAVEMVPTEVEGVVEIVIDNPAAHNALTPAMMVQFADAVAAARGARAILLRGVGDSFCSGGHLAQVRAHLGVPTASRALGSFMTAAVDALCDGDAAVLVAAHGAALGGGAELVAAADVSIAHPAARIGFVHARFGVTPGFGGAGRLVRRVGAARARRLLLEAGVVDAEEALALGLVDAIAEDPLGEAREAAARIAALPAEAIAGARAITRGGDLAAAGARELELETFGKLWGGPAHRAALER
jgi:enoyl-CoA hydratase/carnithine racemase